MRGPAGRTPIMGLLHRMGTRGSFVRLVVATTLIVAVFGVLNPSVFLSRNNLQYVSLATPELAILSLAIAVTMLTAGIDLSVVGIANLSAVVCARVMVSGGSVPAGIAAAFGTALICGLLNGAMVGYLKVSPILATLGSSQLFLGLALVFSKGTVIKGLPSEFTAFALATFAGIPVIFWVMLTLAALTAFLTSKTTLGVRMRLIGSNPTAAVFTGIRSARVLMVTYLISAALAAVAGLIISSRATGANSQYGLSYILMGIVVAVLAGVDPDGGYLTVAGVLIAGLALTLLSSGLLSVGVNAHIVNIAQGSLLVVMMLLNAWGARLLELLRPLARTLPGRDRKVTP